MPDRSSIKDDKLARVLAATEGGIPPAGSKLQIEAVPSELDTHAAAVALGRRGGLKGGPARAKKLSRKRRIDIAKKAAEARWRPKQARVPKAALTDRP